jgi:succinate dehydrogenase hydrophobic anchor subunit
MKKFLEKHVLINYILVAFSKVFLISLVVMGVLFLVFQFTDLYEVLESRLDLKYNSPFVIVPMVGFLVLSLLSAFIGLLMYFYKYKRAKSKGNFSRALSQVLNEKANS